jgi:hypothetical protein
MAWTRHMKYTEFNKFVEGEPHEAIYDDSDGRRIVVIRMLDLYALINELAKLPPVQVSLNEFLMRVDGNEELVGNPVIWAQWPIEEKK